MNKSNGNFQKKKKFPGIFVFYREKMTSLVSWQGNSTEYCKFSFFRFLLLLWIKILNCIWIKMIILIEISISLKMYIYLTSDNKTETVSLVSAAISLINLYLWSRCSVSWQSRQVNLSQLSQNKESLSWKRKKGKQIENSYRATIQLSLQDLSWALSKINFGY